MTLPNFFIVDSDNGAQVTYCYRCNDDQYACMEYDISINYSRGRWRGAYIEDEWDIENEWSYWKERDRVVEYDEPHKDMLDVAKEMFGLLIFK